VGSSTSRSANVKPLHSPCSYNSKLIIDRSLTKRQRSLINQYAAISDPEYAHLAEELGTKPSETSDGFLRGTIGKIFGKDESQQAAKGS